MTVANPTTFAPACSHKSINPFAALPSARKSSTINILSSLFKNLLSIVTSVVVPLVKDFIKALYTLFSSTILDLLFFAKTTGTLPSSIAVTTA